MDRDASNAPGIWQLNGVGAPRLAFAGFKSDLSWTFAGDEIVYVDAPDAWHPHFVKETFYWTSATIMVSADDCYADMTGEYGGGFAVDLKTGRITHVSGVKVDTDIIAMHLVRKGSREARFFHFATVFGLMP